jgi:hypothetical protein
MLNGYFKLQIKQAVTILNLQWFGYQSLERFVSLPEGECKKSLKLFKSQGFSC